MSTHRPDATYDVVVIGSGIGGLTAAGLLAKAGRKVLVLEKETHAGGHAAGLDWQGRPFDAALHLIMGGGRSSNDGEGLVRRVLGQLGTAERCQFVRNNPFYRALFPGFELTVSGTGRKAFVESHARHFPKVSSALEGLLERCARIHLGTLRFPIQPRLWQRLLAPLRFPALVRSVPLTVEDALKQHSINDKAGAALSVLWLYLGLPPSQASFLLWATMTSGMVDEGAFYCRGGFRQMARAFRQGVERQGGEIRTGTPVRKILLEGVSVSGVETEAGQRIRAPAVISNVDARATMRQLVGEEHFPAPYRAKVGGLQPSVRLVSLYTAVPRDLIPREAEHENIVFGSWDHDAVYEEGLAGRISAVTVTIPTLSDRSLTSQDEHLVVLKFMIPPQPALYPEDAPGQLVQQASAVIPGLPEYLGMTPDNPQGDAERYALRTVGPIYGWAQSPQQMGPNGLNNTTPVEGLYLCGHWSQPGAGIRTVVTSGQRVSRLILDDRTSQGIIA
ncbi:MAG TPA: NAD(P)/FAD-dependent oxidoreductase [Acidobacteriota bacterium]|nr:NAD(P)/FAD-dependent oxidoreductase [Acidobacteriota bacterium]